MTDAGEPGRRTPHSGSVPPRAPQTPGSRSGRSDAGDDEQARLAPREQAQIEQSVRLVGRAGRGPLVVAALVAGAFLLGLVRPWDFVAGPVDDGSRATVASGVADAPILADGPVTAPGVEMRTAPPAPSLTPTCAFPSQWRSATIEEWSGRPARVWRAAAVERVTGPDDPALPFEPIVAATVTAIGWCAPVDGPDRPPRDIVATLYRLRDGVPVPVPYDRLEPPDPDAQGELWVPRAQSVGYRPTWPMGRYVIELRSPTGRYVRHLGIELSDVVVRADPGVADPGVAQPGASEPAAGEPGAASPATPP
jgi:hypothetical protein